MLKQEQFDDSQTSRPPSAGAPRVTPDELNAALAAIEARRQADAQTIPLDQAVSDLHLDSAPDEIWAEVQAQRAEAAAAQRTPPRSAVAAEDAPMRLRRGSRRRPFAPLLIVGGILLLSNHGLLPHFGSRHVSVVSTSAAPILRPLSAIPDGTTTYADDAALIQISEGKPLSQITVSTNSTGSRWPLFKRDGHVYLHGYIAQTNSLPSLAGKAVSIFNDDNSGDLAGESTSKITLRVDNTPLQNSGGDSDYSEITVPSFQPDPLTTLSDWR